MSEFLNPDGSVWVPEFEGQRPPFQRGNRVSVGNRGPLRHGASSARVYTPVAKEIEAELRSMPDLKYLWEPEFEALRWGYCLALARERVYEAYVDGMEGPEQWGRAPEGGVTPPAEELRQLMSRTLTFARRIGLTPKVAPEVAELIAKARARIALREGRRSARKAEWSALAEAMRKHMYPDDGGRGR